MEIKYLTRSLLKRIKEEKGFDLFNKVSNTSKDEISFTDEDIDAVMDTVYPEHKNEFDQMKFDEYMSIFTDTVRKSFGGAEEKNS